MPPATTPYFRGCGRYLGCHRRNSAKLPKCTRTDTDTTAYLLNSRHCFQLLLCPEQTWREAPPPISRLGPLPERLVRLCFNNVSMRPGTHLYPNYLLSQGYPLTICSPISIYSPFGSSLLMQMPAKIFPVRFRMVEVRCPSAFVRSDIECGALPG